MLKQRFWMKTVKMKRSICTATVRMTHTVQGISKAASFQQCSGRFTKNCALHTGIESAGTSPTATIGGEMALAICCLSAPGTIELLKSGQETDRYYGLNHRESTKNSCSCRKWCRSRSKGRKIGSKFSPQKTWPYYRGFAERKTNHARVLH